MFDAIRLKHEYRESNERIGKTGAGLSLSDVAEGSELWNVIRMFNTTNDAS